MARASQERRNDDATNMADDHDQAVDEVPASATGQPLPRSVGERSEAVVVAVEQVAKATEHRALTLATAALRGGGEHAPGHARERQ